MVCIGRHDVEIWQIDRGGETKGTFSYRRKKQWKMGNTKGYKKEAKGVRGPF